MAAQGRGVESECEGLVAGRLPPAARQPGAARSGKSLLSNDIPPFIAGAGVSQVVA